MPSYYEIPKREKKENTKKAKKHGKFFFGETALKGKKDNEN